MKKMLVTVGVNRRLKGRKRPVPYFKQLYGCPQSRAGTIYEGSLDYEHGPNNEEAENGSRQLMQDIVHAANLRHQLQSSLEVGYIIPPEEQEIISIADLGLTTIFRGKYDWDCDLGPSPTDGSFIRYEYTPLQSHRGSSGGGRAPSRNPDESYDEPTPLFQ